MQCVRAAFGERNLLSSIFLLLSSRTPGSQGYKEWNKKAPTFHANCRDALRSVAIFCVHRV